MQVMKSAIKRRLDANGGDGVVVLVKVDGSRGTPEDLLAVVEAARNAANDALNRNEELVWGAPASPSPKGPVVNIDWTGTDDEIDEWLDVLAAELAARGRSGRVEAAPQANFPNDFGSLVAAARLTASMAFTLSDPTAHGYPPFTWLVDGSSTRALVDQGVRWGAFPGARVYLAERASQFIVDDPRPIETWRAAIERSGSTQLTYLSPRPYEWRIIGTGPLGEAVYQAAAIDKRWESFVEQLREPLLHHGPRLDLAFIRFSRSSAPTFLDQGLIPEPPGVHSVGDFTRNRHIYDAYVPDAHAIQVLTAKHLDKAHDLSAWTTTALGNERYLVEARDLEPWFTDSAGTLGERLPQPDASLLTAARRDFGGMIITHADLEADPQAWLPGRPPRIVIHPKPR